MKHILSVCAIAIVLTVIHGCAKGVRVEYRVETGHVIYVEHIPGHEITEQVGGVLIRRQISDRYVTQVEWRGGSVLYYDGTTWSVCKNKFRQRVYLVVGRMVYGSGETTEYVTAVYQTQADAENAMRGIIHAE